jgi:5'(3')-deoxyribonucleotidase
MNEINRTVYVDMDGVIVNFNGGIERISGKPRDYFGSDDSAWSVAENYGVERFFIDLEWLDDGKELWSYVTSNFLRVKILSAMGKRNEVDNVVYKGKMTWLRRHIPSLRESDIILVVNKHKKQEYSKPNDIMIDDTKIVIDEWISKGGIGILHTNTRNTIKTLEQYV